MPWTKNHRNGCMGDCRTTPHPRPRERALLASDPTTRKGAWREGSEAHRQAMPLEG